MEPDFTRVVSSSSKELFTTTTITTTSTTTTITTTIIMDTRQRFIRSPRNQSCQVNFLLCHPTRCRRLLQFSVSVQEMREMNRGRNGARTLLVVALIQRWMDRKSHGRRRDASCLMRRVVTGRTIIIMMVLIHLLVGGIIMVEVMEAGMEAR